jgi:antiphage defense system Thoeris ThsB-like protein
MADEIKNVFISHVHEDDDGLADLKELIKKGDLAVRDSSINSSSPNDAKDPDYIKSEVLAPQIQWASTLLVYITPKTKDSPWVNWEIEYAEKEEKRIVGVYARGANECDVPEALEKYADDVRGWQSDGIVDAILAKTNEWLLPSGELRPLRPIKRYSCGA